MEPNSNCSTNASQSSENTSSETWRHETEVRHVVHLMSAGRGPARQYLDLVARSRGIAAMRRLEADAAEQWRKRND